MIEKIASLVFMISLFYITVSNVTNFTGIDFDSLTQLIAEFDKGFIDDIKVKEMTEKCDKDYSEMMIGYDYPGNYQGCLCKSKDNKETTIFGSCTDVQCLSFDETKVTPMTNWKTKLICYRRSSLKLKDAVLINLDNNDCGNKFKLCGIADTLGNALCINNSFSCPISNIKFVDTSSCNYYLN